MLRFVALVHGAEEANTVLVDRLLASSTAWRVVFKSYELSVLCRDLVVGSNEVYRLSHLCGVVVGKLFKTGAPGEAHQHSTGDLSTDESEGILASQGRRLISHYWGRYVAFLRNPVSGDVKVIRSPGAALTCLRVQIGETHVYCSELEDVLPFMQRSPTIDFDYLGAWLALGVNSRETLLKEARALVPGECATVRAGRESRELYWNPLHFARGARIDTLADALVSLRQAVRAATYAWSGCYRRLMLQLSGGLDSSILAACLTDVPASTSVLCCHHFVEGHEGPASDERKYARAVAATTGLTYLEIPRDPYVDLSSMLTVRRRATLWNLIHSAEVVPIESAIAESEKVDAIVTGDGGDQVFSGGPGVAAAADALPRLGLGRRWWTVALDAARMDRAFVGSVAWQAAWAQMPGRSWSVRSQVNNGKGLLSEQTLKRVARQRNLDHPWLQEADRASDFTRWHGTLLTSEPPWYEPLQSNTLNADLVTPLLSQPVIEAAFQIAPELHIFTGWDRAVARLAFEGVVPDAVIGRRVKGEWEEHNRRLLLYNRELVEALLTGGILARHGVIDTQTTKQSLQANSDVLSLGILVALSAEAHLRAWDKPINS